MAIYFVNPLELVEEAEEIAKRIDVLSDLAATYTEKQEARSWLHGAIKVHRSKGHRGAVAYMKQAIQA